MFWLKKKIRFETVANQVLESKKLNAPGTYYQAKFHINRLTLHFGLLDISELSEADWTQYVLLQMEKKPRKFFDDRKYMRVVLNFAARENLRAKKIKLPIPDLPSDVGREVTHAERQKLLSSAGGMLRFQIEIAWKMGLRLTEMMHLRWDQVDLERQMITLHSAKVKTRRGRKVPINPDLTLRFSLLKARSTGPAASPYLFPSEKNPNLPKNSNRGPWRRCKRKTGIDVRWHDLRHTCATELLRNGITVHVASRYLGMSIKVLLRIYYHLNDSDLKAASAAMSQKSHL